MCSEFVKINQKFETTQQKMERANQRIGYVVGLIPTFALSLSLSVIYLQNSESKNWNNAVHDMTYLQLFMLSNSAIGGFIVTLFECVTIRFFRTQLFGLWLIYWCLGCIISIIALTEFVQKNPEYQQEWRSMYPILIPTWSIWWFLHDVCYTQKMNKML